MKKVEKVCLVALCLFLGLVVPARAVSENVVVAMKLGSPWCVVGDALVMVDAGNRSVVPVSETVAGGGRTLVPIRRVMEAFGGTVTWLADTNGVVCTLGEKRVELTLGADVALVDGLSVGLDVPAKIMGGRTFVPLRFVSEQLGLAVGYEVANRIAVISRSPVEPATLSALPQVKQLAARTSGTGDPTSLRTEQFALSNGAVKANIITVDMNDLRVSVKMVMANGTLNTTKPFQGFIGGDAPVAVINGNFFESNQAIRDPIGHVMSDGQILFGNSGTSALGITADNEMRYGRPPVFVRVVSGGGKPQQWSAYAVNIMPQFEDGSVLYTPARGVAVPVKCAGVALRVENGVATDYRAVSVGETLAIPSNGFVLFMGRGFTTTDYYQVPILGQKITLEPYLQVADAEGFQLEGVQQIASGAPRLVRDGAVATELDPGFTEARFTTAVVPRTVVGTTKDGKLLLVSTPAASIQQMRELMLQLGCVDAINLDGGASCGMYYRGNTIATPGRELTTTLQVFVDR